MMKWLVIMITVALISAAGGAYIHGRLIQWKHEMIVAATGSTAVCVDGHYTTSKSRSGTCSGHKGVKLWILH